MPSIRRLLRHRVEIVRATQGGDSDSDWNQPDIDWVTVANGVPALVQERTGRQVVMSHESGPVVITALIFFDFDADITERDRVVRPSTGRTYEVLYVKDAAGWGHHWQVDAQLIETGDEMLGSQVRGFLPSRTEVMAGAVARAREQGLGVEDAADRLATAIQEQAERKPPAPPDGSQEPPPGAAPAEGAPTYSQPWDPPPGESWNG